MAKKDYHELSKEEIADFLTKINSLITDDEILKDENKLSNRINLDPYYDDLLDFMKDTRDISKMRLELNNMQYSLSRALKENLFNSFYIYYNPTEIKSWFETDNFDKKVIVGIGYMGRDAMGKPYSKTFNVILTIGNTIQREIEYNTFPIDEYSSEFIYVITEEEFDLLLSKLHSLIFAK